MDTATPQQDHPIQAAEMRARIVSKLTYDVGKSASTASPRDWFLATALAVRDDIVDHWFESTRRTYESGAKRVYYLSLEFLIGRLLSDAIGNLGLTPVIRDALAQEGVDLDVLREQEPDAALGNGGLGRLAACFMESMATLGIAAYGYGIRYEQGLFRQVIEGGVQQELPDDWLRFGNPWEFERPEVAYPIGFGGAVAVRQEGGQTAYAWHPSEQLEAIAYDTPVIGGPSSGGPGGASITRTRCGCGRRGRRRRCIWRRSTGGITSGAMQEKVRTEAVSRVLYPGDDSDAGQELRLRQEFFFASASLQDLLRRHVEQFGTLSTRWRRRRRCS